jgi:hypothetical protein
MMKQKYIKNEKGEEIGHVCLNCGKHHVWGGYVMAHWRDDLTHTCNCGQISSIQEGVVVFGEPRS